MDIKVIDNAVAKFRPRLIVVSTGSANMENTGNSVSVVQAYCGKIPIFGVGAGQGCIIKAFEGRVDRCPMVKHGRIAKVKHDGKTIFKKLENPFNAGLYNSLCSSDVPYSLEVSARSENDIVMGVRHKDYFVEGIQFDPSSLLTVSGSMIIDNLLKEVSKK